MPALLHASLKKKTKKMNIKHRPKSLRLSGLTDVCGKVSVYFCTDRALQTLKFKSHYQL